MDGCKNGSNHLHIKLVGFDYLILIQLISGSKQSICIQSNSYVLAYLPYTIRYGMTPLPNKFEQKRKHILYLINSQDIPCHDDDSTMVYM